MALGDVALSSVLIEISIKTLFLATLLWMKENQSTKMADGKSLVDQLPEKIRKMLEKRPKARETTDPRLCPSMLQGGLARSCTCQEDQRCHLRSSSCYIYI